MIFDATLPALGKAVSVSSFGLEWLSDWFDDSSGRLTFYLQYRHVVHQKKAPVHGKKDRSDIGTHWISRSHLNIHWISSSFLNIHRIYKRHIDIYWISRRYLNIHWISRTNIDIHWMSRSYLDIRRITRSHLDIPRISRSHLAIHWIYRSQLDVHWISRSHLDIHWISRSDLDIHWISRSDVRRPGAAGTLKSEKPVFDATKPYLVYVYMYMCVYVYILIKIDTSVSTTWPTLEKGAKWEGYLLQDHKRYRPNTKSSRARTDNIASYDISEKSIIIRMLLVLCKAESYTKFELHFSSHIWENVLGNSAIFAYVVRLMRKQFVKKFDIFCFGCFRCIFKRWSFFAWFKNSISSLKWLKIAKVGLKFTKSAKNVFVKNDIFLDFGIFVVFLTAYHFPHCQKLASSSWNGQKSIKSEILEKEKNETEKENEKKKQTENEKKVEMR